MSNKLLLTSAFALSFASYGANAESLSEKIDRLEQEVQLLKRQQEVAEEKATAAAEKSASVEYGPKGLVITSPDKRAQLKLRAYGQVDTRTFADNSNVSNVDNIVLRTARPVLDATFDKDFAARLMLDFGNNQTRLLDAYVDYKPDSLFNIRLGKFKLPVGLERWQSEQELLSVERGQATNLTPLRDVGLQFYGEIIPQQLEYQLALTDGVADTLESSSDIDGAKEIAGRIFAHPFRNSDYVDLQGLGVGIAGSYASIDGSASATGLTEGYRSPGQARFFSYNAGTFADGSNWRINPQGYYYNGPFGTLAEYIAESQEVNNGTTKEKLQHDAWTLAASYVLTGEDASFDGVKPAQNFSLTDGGWGAFEVLARAGATDIDNDSFAGFANNATAASEANELTAGLNWHLNPNLKINTSYSQTEFEGGAAGGDDRETEKVYMTRAQFRF